MRAVGDSARYDVFQLGEAAAAGDAPRALRVLMGLRNEGVEPTLILWALVRELRGLWQARERTAPALELRAAALESGGDAVAARARARSARCRSRGCCAQAITDGPRHQGPRRRAIRGRPITALAAEHGRRFASHPDSGRVARMNPMGIFGGTFDPIHYAHLRTAFELQQALRLKEIRFLPAGNPPHRDQPLADAQLRLKMVELATAGQPGFVVDDREVRKDGPVLFGRDPGGAAP